MSIGPSAAARSPQMELDLFGDSAVASGFPAVDFQGSAARDALPLIALDPKRAYPALQSSFSNRSQLEDCPRQTFEHLRRYRGSKPDAAPEDREIYLLTTLQTLPEVLGHIVHDAIAFSLSEACGKQIGAKEFAPSRIVPLDELLNRASRKREQIIGLSAAASRLHYSADPKRFPLLLEDVLEMHRRPVAIGERHDVPAHVWREEIWRDIKECITNFYELFFAPTVLGVDSEGHAHAGTAGFTKLRPGRFPVGDYLSIEGWRESSFSSDSQGSERSSAPWPFFSLPITHTIRLPDQTLQRRRYDAKNICVIDFAHAEPDRSTWSDAHTPPGRIVISDWKTNKLDPATGRPFGKTGGKHLEQLAEYAVYMMEHFPGVSPEDILLRVYYLRGNGIPAARRVEEYSAVSIDPSPGMAKTRERIRLGMQDRANRFIDPETDHTDAQYWPTTKNTAHCRYCKVAGRCEGAPPEVRERMNFGFASPGAATGPSTLRVIDEGLR